MTGHEPPALVPERRRGSGLSALRRVSGRPDEFVSVLVLLATSYVLFAVTSARWARVLVAAIYVVTLVTTVHASGPTRRQARVVGALVLLGVLASGVEALLLPFRDVLGVTDVMLTVLLGFTLALLLRRVLHHRTVTVQTIAGALSAYLLIGMTFTSVYGVLSWLSDDPFFASGASQEIPDLQYFSFTTLTTLGYGDLTAATGAGRGLATFEALVGQIFLATLVASLVASFREAHRAPPPGCAGDDQVVR